MKNLNVTLEHQDLKTNKFPLGGFYQEWLGGEVDAGEDVGKVEFALTSGAGLGNPILCLRVEIKGETYYFNANMATELEQMVNQVIDEVAD